MMDNARLYYVGYSVSNRRFYLNTGAQLEKLQKRGEKWPKDLELIAVCKTMTEAVTVMANYRRRW